MSPRRRVPAVRAALAVSAALMMVAVPAATAQTATAAGRVVVPRGADTLPVPRTRVLLHRVGRDRQGPIDSTTSDAAGAFHFAFRADTGALYLLSARYGGIEYFSPPVHTASARPDTGLNLTVYDTSSTAAIRVDARHIVVPRASQDGTRSVLDLIVLGNPGMLARVAPDSAHPSWSLALPSGVIGMDVGEGDLSPDAIVRTGDSIHVLAPLAPGQKQLSLEYVIPAGRTEIGWPMGPAGAELNLLVEDRGARVTGGTLAPADTQVVEGRRFQRYTGRLPPSGVARLRLPGGRPASWPVLATLVAAVAGVLAVAAWRLLRQPRAVPGLAPATDADGLLDAIAALDARHPGRADEASAEERRAYEIERARLKAALERALAGGRASR